MNPVLDASVFVAVLSPAEFHHEQARALYRRVADDQPFLVPALFRLEVLAALARRRESPETLELVDAIVRGPRFYACPIEAGLLDDATRIARRAGLRAYDALYAALAEKHGTPLYTLDREVRARLGDAFPGIQVHDGA